MEQKHLFCFGLGFSALHLAHYLLDEGWRVSGTSRHMDKIESLRPQGITGHLFDKGIPLLDETILQNITHLLISIPPDEEDGDLVLSMYKELIPNLPNLEHITYLSTTGVYGDHDGGWVDETTPTNPPNARSIRRVDAENAWMALGVDVHIFRLSGIYGPGRNALESLKQGTAKRIDKQGQVFSRIHVEDIAQTLYKAMHNPQPGIYNLADDMPASQADVVAYAAKLLGINPPDLIPYDKAHLSPMAYSFYQNNRRVKNDKIKDAFDVNLTYPSYKEGLQQLCEALTS